MDGNNFTLSFLRWSEVKFMDLGLSYESLHAQVAMNCTMIAIVIILYLNLSFQVFKFLI